MKITKEKILYIILVIGILPLTITAGITIFYMFAGVPAYNGLFTGTTNIIYGLEALEYILIIIGILIICLWYIVIPWLILLIIVPAILLIRMRIKAKRAEKTKKIEEIGKDDEIYSSRKE